MVNSDLWAIFINKKKASVKLVKITPKSYEMGLSPPSYEKFLEKCDISPLLASLIGFVFSFQLIEIGIMSECIKCIPELVL